MLGRVFDEWQNGGSSDQGRPDRPRRRGLKIFVALMLFAAAIGATGVTYYRWCQAKPDGPQLALSLAVPRGSSGSEVVSMLHDRGVIRCGLVSRLEVKRRHETFEAGTYRLSTNMALDDALDVMERGPAAPPSVRLTIPEGWRLTQMAARVQEELGIPSTEFLDAATSRSYSLRPYLPPGTPTVEGFLFPNTYRFIKRIATASSVIHELLQEFATEVGSLPWVNARRLGVSDYQVVTIASMIEREARVPRDRAKIAAVIYNRLKIGMSLGIDATIQYIDPNPSDGLTDSDLHIDSPYNTRLHAGLPPTPIASPGLASLRAALDPAHVGYLYYVLCGADGHHAFANTNAEFLQLKARCLG
jgi:UPF0755 protein